MTYVGMSRIISLVKEGERHTFKIKTLNPYLCEGGAGEEGAGLVAAERLGDDVVHGEEEVGVEAFGGGHDEKS